MSDGDIQAAGAPTRRRTRMGRSRGRRASRACCRASPCSPAPPAGRGPGKHGCWARHGCRPDKTGQGLNSTQSKARTCRLVLASASWTAAAAAARHALAVPPSQDMDCCGEHARCAALRHICVHIDPDAASCSLLDRMRLDQTHLDRCMLHAPRPHCLL